MVRIFRFRRGRSAAAEADAPLTADAGAQIEQDGEQDGEQAQQEAAELSDVIEASTARTRGGVLGRLGGVFRRGGVDEEFWEQLEEILIGADVGVRTTGALIERVRERADGERVREAAGVRDLLREEMVALLRRPAERGRLWLSEGDGDGDGDGKGGAAIEGPEVILVVGVNGAGKTTSIAKLAQAYRDEGRSVILGAADTFRAAAIEQLQYWGKRVDVPVIAHQAGGDPGAVAYDTVSAAQARGIDVVIIDTAGRLQTKKNLMAELGKIRRVIAGREEGAPHEVLLVLDATTGQNGLSQARVFGEATEVTAICLAKLDGSSKGGIVFGIADELGVPVRFVGTGEKATDLAPFDAQIFVDALFAESS